MSLSREQAQALTRLVHLLRPAWNEEGIYAALAKVKERDAYDVALAALRAAADGNAKTPGVIPSPGPHWNEAEPVEPKRPHLSRAERRARTCDTCGALDGCKPPAHDFVALDHATRDRTDRAAEVRAALVAERARVMGDEPAGTLAAERQSEVIADLSRQINAEEGAA